MSKIFTEENGVYNIDCTNAIWATDKMHRDYHEAGIHINDADFVIESKSHLLIVEYKNAAILGACNPNSFNPMADKKRKRLRNRLKEELPFTLQKNINTGIKLIDKVDVVSIKEWNEDEKYGEYPIFPIAKNQLIPDKK